MIKFENWQITAPDNILGYQFDNLTRAIVIQGDIPDGWDWFLTFAIDDNLDIIQLSEIERTDTGTTLAYTLNRQQMSVVGVYTLQLEGRQGDKVRHTNQISMYVSDSLSGDEHWVTIPSEFTDLEKRLQQLAKDAAASATKSESWAVGGTGTREGEDTNNSRYWAGKAKEEADGAKDHNKLYNRDKPDQHPIGAISGLQQALDGKQPTGDYLTTGDVSQTVGTEPDKVPSNKAVSDALNNKFDKSSVSDTVADDAKTVPSNKAVWDELGKAEYRNLIVNVEQTGLGFRADYKASEILNFADSGGTVEMHYNGSVFPFIGREQGQAVFRVPRVTATEVKSLGAKVQENYSIIVEDVLYTPDAENTSAVVPAGLPDGTKENVQDVLNAMQTQAGDLEHDKFGIIRVAVDREITQPIIADIIANYANYEGQIIEFLANGDTPSRTIAYGFAMMGDSGNQYVTVINLDGTLTQWNKSTHEDHNFECKSFVNEMCDLDNLTIDVQGDAPFLASVRDAINRPERDKTSVYGTCTTIAYAVDKQIQLYRDMETGKEWYRLISGQADRHSFGTWEVIGGGALIDDEKQSPQRVYSSHKTDNRYGEAIEGSASGSVVAVDDVSKIEHDLGVRVERVNYADISAFKVMPPIDTAGWIDSVETNRIVVKNKNNSAGYSATTIRFKELVPNLKENDMFTFTFKTTSRNRKYIFLYEANMLIYSGDTKTVASTMLDSQVVLYADYNGGALVTTEITDFQIQKGTVATPYQPYIPDLTAVTVWRYGGNLLPELPARFDSNGLTTTFKNGIISVKGTPVAGYPVLTKWENLGFKIPVGSKVWVKVSKSFTFDLAMFFSTTDSSAEQVGVDIVSGQTKNSKVLQRPDLTRDAFCYLKITIFNFKEPTVDETFEIGFSFSPDVSETFETPNLYTPDSSGNVQGIASIEGSNDITLLSSAGSAVTLTADYHKSPAVTVSRLADRLAALESKTTNI